MLVQLHVPPAPLLTSPLPGLLETLHPLGEGVSGPHRGRQTLSSPHSTALAPQSALGLPQSPSGAAPTRSQERNVPEMIAARGLGDGPVQAPPATHRERRRRCGRPLVCSLGERTPEQAGTRPPASLLSKGLGAGTGDASGLTPGLGGQPPGPQRVAGMPAPLLGWGSPCGDRGAQSCEGLPCSIENGPGPPAISCLPWQERFVGWFMARRLGPGRVEVGQ